MNIYVAHSNKFDYITKLYEPIKNAKMLSKHNFFFPHDEVNKLVKTKEIIEDYDLVIAEVSLPATGLGIELGWLIILTHQYYAYMKKDQNLAHF